MANLSPERARGVAYEPHRAAAWTLTIMSPPCCTGKIQLARIETQRNDNSQGPILTSTKPQVPSGWNSRLGTGRSWTDTLCGPSKTTAFMVLWAILFYIRDGAPVSTNRQAMGSLWIENLDGRGVRGLAPVLNELFASKRYRASGRPARPCVQVSAGKGGNYVPVH